MARPEGFEPATLCDKQICYEKEMDGLQSFDEAQSAECQENVITGDSRGGQTNYKRVTGDRRSDDNVTLGSWYSRREPAGSGIHSKEVPVS